MYLFTPDIRVDFYRRVVRDGRIDHHSRILRPFAEIEELVVSFLRVTFCISRTRQVCYDELIHPAALAVFDDQEFLINIRLECFSLTMTEQTAVNLIVVLRIERGQDASGPVIRCGPRIVPGGSKVPPG